MPTSQPVSSEPTAAAEPCLTREREVASQVPDPEPELPGEHAEPPESLYAIHRRRRPRWISDGSGS